MLRIYRLTSTSAVTAVGQATTTVVNKGRIKQIALIVAPANCTATGNISSEIALNNSNNGNATVASLQSTDNLLARGSVGMAVGTGCVVLPQRVDLNRPVNPGDILCINVIATGTFSSCFHCYDVYVEE